jgi:hypothetical protein
MGGSKTTIQAPAAPNYGQSMSEILDAQIKYAPKVYAQEAIYQPLYQKLQSQIEAQTAADQIALYQKLQPGYSQLEDAYTKATQANQLQGLQQTAPGYIKAFQAAQGTAGINQAMQNYAEQNLGQQLNAGFKLSPEEQRQLDQQSMSGYAARGTALGSQAGLANVLNRYQYVQGRQQQALGQATGIGGYLSQQSQPALASYYQQPMYAGSFGGSAVQNAMMGQQQAGAQYFNPESQVGMGSIYGAYNAQMGLAGAQAQANAGKSAGMMGMLGSLGGAAIGAGGMMGGASIMKCWVAREVYGATNPAWVAFRDWLTHDAPKWLDNAYIKYGERIAAFIKDKPVLKNLIRRWMDSKIA